MAKPKPDETERDEDTRGQKYVNIEKTVRITYVPGDDRRAAKNWAKQDVIRIQAYVAAKGGRLHRGAEIPVDGAAGVLKLIKALTELHEKIREKKSR